MPTLSHRVLRWPFTLSASNNDLEFSETALPGNRGTETIPAGDYISKGETGTGTPTDYVTAFQTMMTAAMATMGLGGAGVATLGTDGKMLLSRAGGADFDIEWTNVNTTLDPRLAGYATLQADTTVTTTPTAAPYQVRNAWYAGIDYGRDTGNVDRRIYRTVKALNGRPYQVSHSSGNFFNRDLFFDFVRSARIVQYRTDDAAFATVAGLTVADPNAAIVNLKDYLLAETGWPEPGKVYVYSTNDPATHTEEGGYNVSMTKFWAELGGPDDSKLTPRMSAESYNVPLELWISG